MMARQAFYVMRQFCVAKVLCKREGALPLEISGGFRRVAVSGEHELD